MFEDSFFQVSTVVNFIAPPGVTIIHSNSILFRRVSEVAKWLTRDVNRIPERTIIPQ